MNPLLLCKFLATTLRISVGWVIQATARQACVYRKEKAAPRGNHARASRSILEALAAPGQPTKRAIETSLYCIGD